MARITLKQRWDSLEVKIKELENQRLEMFFETNPKPNVAYKCTHLGEIETYNVVGFSISFKNGFNFKPHYEKSPTRKDLEYLTQYYESAKTSEFDVRINFAHIQEKHTSRSSSLYHKMDVDNSLSFNKDDLRDLSLLRREAYAPREGFKPCNYCRKQTLSEKLITKTIIGRGRKSVWNSRKGQYESKACVTQESLKFCSEQCAAYEQMSREG